MDEKELKIVLQEFNTRIKELTRRPTVEQAYRLSKDGKYLIHETKIVDIKPISYMDKVLKQTQEDIVESALSDVVEELVE